MDRLQEIEARKLEIRNEVEATEDIEKIEELTQEVEVLDEEISQIEEQKENEEVAEELEEKSYLAKEIELKKEGEKMDKEVRNSKEYIEAYAEYVKDGEMRALLTENATDGTVAVPDFVEEIVKTAWEKDDIMSLVRKVEVKGNLKVNFEISGEDAVIHTEGDPTPVKEEELVLGIVELKPQSIKKWISISDEVYDMRGEAFLRYIYDELTYKIVKKTADTLVGIIANLPQTATPNSVSANKIEAAPGFGTIFNAISNLSDDAGDYTIVMNKMTYGKFKEEQMKANFAADIFDGIRVRFNNTLPAYDTATTGQVYAIVGDFNEGALANYPAGDGVDLKFDDKTLMTSDLIRILGRQYVGVNAVADKAFVQIAKPASV